jgi:hypothetical protein
MARLQLSGFSTTGMSNASSAAPLTTPQRGLSDNRTGDPATGKNSDETSSDSVASDAYGTLGFLKMPCPCQPFYVVSLNMSDRAVSSRRDAGYLADPLNSGALP